MRNRIEVNLSRSMYEELFKDYLKRVDEDLERKAKEEQEKRGLSKTTRGKRK